MSVENYFLCSCRLQCLLFLVSIAGYYRHEYERRKLFSMLMTYLLLYCVLEILLDILLLVQNKSSESEKSES